VTLASYFMTTAAGALDLDRPDGLEDAAWAAIDEPLQRLNRALAEDDQSLVVGTCKDLAEALAKVVLAARGETTASNEDFPKLVTQAQVALKRQPGRGLASDAQIRDVAQAAQKVINNLPTLRNRFGTGHGRALVPEVAEEVVLLSVDMTMMWTRWALRHLTHVIFGRPEALITELSGGTFRRGELAARLEAANLGDLDPADQSAVAVAVAHRALRDTFNVMDEGVERCTASTDTAVWPPAYRTGLINGLLLSAEGQLDTNVWAVRQIVMLLSSMDNAADVLAAAAEKCKQAWLSPRLDNPRARAEVCAAMNAERDRLPFPASMAWDHIANRIVPPPF